MRVEVESQQESDAAISGSPSEPARRSKAEGRQRRLIVSGIELVAVARVLGSRRFLEHAIVGAIGLAAVARMARENEARALARFIAWDKRRNLLAKGTPRARRRTSR